MRKSVRVTLTTVAAVGLASCNRRRMDPCDAASFNDLACQESVQSGGYYWQGSWYPMSYGRPYPYYYQQYNTYVSRGGAVSPTPPGAYSRPAGAASRGGFGASGEAHGASGAHGAGE